MADHEGADLVIHGKDGEIPEEDSHGNDTSNSGAEPPAIS